MKIVFAWKTYQHRHVFHVANRQKVDIDDTNSEKTIGSLRLVHKRSKWGTATITTK